MKTTVVIFIMLMVSSFALAEADNIEHCVHELDSYVLHLPEAPRVFILASARRILSPEGPHQIEAVRGEVDETVKYIMKFLKGASDQDLDKMLDDWGNFTFSKDGRLPGREGGKNEKVTNFDHLRRNPVEFANAYNNFTMGILSTKPSSGSQYVSKALQGYRLIFGQLLLHEFAKRKLETKDYDSVSGIKRSFDIFEEMIAEEFIKH